MSTELSNKLLEKSLSATNHRNEPFLPKEIAKQWRRAGAVRIQDADYLQVLSTTDKPEVSGPLAIEMRLLPPEQRAWIREELSRIEKEEINNLEVAKCLQVAKEFDEFLAAKFPTVKRYGLEGSETILLWFDTIIKEIENTHLVIGMTHRGRNNLLVCLLGLQAEEGFIFFCNRYGYSILNCSTSSSDFNFKNKMAYV